MNKLTEIMTLSMLVGKPVVIHMQKGTSQAIEEGAGTNFISETTQRGWGSCYEGDCESCSPGYVKRGNVKGDGYGNGNSNNFYDTSGRSRSTPLSSMLYI